MIKPRVKNRSRLIPFEVMDTTLRDGEQTDGVSILGEEKMAIARMLLENLKVDRIEVASARVSDGEYETVRMIANWAHRKKFLKRVEVLGFVDHKASVDWVHSTGCRVINLLTKGSREHCETQLRRSLREHLRDISRTVRYGSRKNIEFNVYLEDWSGGMLNSPDYVVEMIEAMQDMAFRRIMLPDTLGLLETSQVEDFVGCLVEQFPDTWFDFHAHNDYGLATANSLAGLHAGARGIHATINGLGERTGNAPLDELVVATRDFTRFRCSVNEKKLKDASRLIEIFTGKTISWNKPITGEGVFTQTAGIHADGDKKGQLYHSRLSPVRFDRTRTYAMGKLMGKASLDFNLKKMNIVLNDDQKKRVLQKIVALADTKKTITTEDLPFIIADVLQRPEEREFEVLDYMVTCNYGLEPAASVLVRYKDKRFHAVASGDGGFDAFVKAMRSLEPRLGFRIPKLLDYSVRIPPGGQTDALVETTISWEGGFKTRGVNSDQVAAAIQATADAVNLSESRPAEKKTVRSSRPRKTRKSRQ
jgi:D-citramalate synthase